MGSPRPGPRSSRSPTPRRGERLQKVLASCGVGSRRACELLIAQGQVTVDGEVVTRQGVTVDPDRQEIRVAGRRVRPEAAVYYILHKPRGVLCTSRDPEGRATVHDLLPGGLGRLYTVGRLDRDSEGLLVVTNDGALAQGLTHPRHHVEKTYQVWLDAPLAAADRRRLVEGMVIEGEPMRALSVADWGRDGRAGTYRVVLGEGRKRQIRRMMAACGRTVERLRRVSIGSLRLGSLPVGGWRPLGGAEVERLRGEAGLGVVRGEGVPGEFGEERP
jgi:23S rRNA pseudouridine2605 synthase